MSGLGVIAGGWRSALRGGDRVSGIGVVEAGIGVLVAEAIA
ncbi:hypothetical protein ABH920_007679 [Catenulispora sp. EB89]